MMMRGRPTVLGGVVLVVAWTTTEALHMSFGRVCRRDALAASFGLATTVAVSPERAGALVKGSAPPPKSGSKEKLKRCTNIDECEEIAEEKMTFAASAPFETTGDGVRYRDVTAGASAQETPVAKGDVVNIKYRVMRLGKRSMDNLSGEASPVFSLGYGEDDDDVKDMLTAKVAAGELIPALDSAILGMRSGGVRRLFVVPEKGWKKINSSCTAESNGALNTGMASAGGLDTLGQAVVPLAQVVDNEACIEDTRQPQPRNFGARRRLARRFDEGLLLEVELVNNLGNKF